MLNCPFIYKANMSEEYSYRGMAADLLHQLEDILESDPLIDELGFIHPSQFPLLNEGSGISHSSSDKALPQSGNTTRSSGESLVDNSNQVNEYFWIRDHKLAVSTNVLLPLYEAASLSFMAAFKQYKIHTNRSHKVENSSPGSSSPHDHLENIIMRHSKSLLLLSSDFMTAWNSRKLVVSKKKHLSMFMNELLLSALVLSCSPKSEQAWNHRRWVLKSISANCSNFKGVLEKESELVENIAERSKMNYRAWNHRSWLISHMEREQVFLELEKSRSWAALHVADNCCFHYRRRLLLKILEDPSCMKGTLSSSCNIDIYQLWKDELDWNEILIKRFVGREALWLHRRFLSLCWTNNFLTDSCDASCNSNKGASLYHDFGTFLENELSLLRSCSTIVDNDFEDCQAQAAHSASYIVWLKMQVPKPLGIELLEKLREVDLKLLLDTSIPERTLLFNSIIT